MGLTLAINLSVAGISDDIQVLVDAVLRLVEGEAEKGEKVADLEGRVMMHGAAADGVETGCIIQSHGHHNQDNDHHQRIIDLANAKTAHHLPD